VRRSAGTFGRCLTPDAWDFQVHTFDCTHVKNVSHTKLLFFLPHNPRELDFTSSYQYTQNRRENEKRRKKRGNDGKRDTTRHGNNTTEEAREIRVEKSPSWMSDGARAKEREGEDRARDGDATERRVCMVNAPSYVTVSVRYCHS
jgi:hypothetical protein